jgi:hypothetical protein
MQLTVASRFAGPPNMGHGGYVAGLLASRLTTAGGPAVQLTLRRPVPLDAPLDLVAPEGEAPDAGHLELRRDGELIVEGQVVGDDALADVVVPAPPTVDEARAAEAGSPSHYNDGRGVHPTCFGCGAVRPGGDGLRIFVGPTADGTQVAGVWRPDAEQAADPLWVLAALDCPGAFAFISQGTRAGLLGRIVFQQHAAVEAGADHVVTGWQIATEGRKMFAGTALFDAAGTRLATAKATWFGAPGSPPPGAGA